MRRKVLWLTFWVTMVLWFGQGCAVVGPSSHNESNRLIGAERIPGLIKTEPMEFAGEPSVTGMDRSNWPVTTIKVSRHDTASRHVYWEAVTLRSDEGPRQTGEYPTANSVHDLADTTPAITSQALEIVMEPVWYACDIVMLPWKLVTTHRWRSRQYGPIHGYELVPGDADDVVVYPAID